MSESRKRFLFVTDLWTEQPYGILTVVTNLRAELKKRGHIVDVMEPHAFRTVPFPAYKGVRLALFARGSVRRAIAMGEYDHVHILTEGALGVYARAACRTLRVPFTTAFNGQLHLYAEKWFGRTAGKFAKRLLIWFHAGALAVLVSTPALERELRDEFGISCTRVCPLGIHPRFFARGTCPANLQKPVFLYFGRLAVEKNVEEFLALDLPGTKLLIGDGPDRARLESKYPNARYVGFQDERLVDWIACANVCVMPSKTETFGLSMVEALAQGIPIAAHDVTGPREIVKNGVNGFLGDDLAAAAQQCLTLSRDACQQSVEKYSWAATADAFLDAVNSLSSHGTSD